MTIRLLLFLTLFLNMPFNMAFSKSLSNQDLIAKAKQLVLNDPDQAMRISQSVLKNTNDPADEIQALLVQAEIYSIQSKYDKLIQALFSAKNKNLLLDDPANELKICIYLSRAFWQIRLMKQACGQMNTAARILARRRGNYFRSMRPMLLFEQLKRQQNPYVTLNELQNLKERKEAVKKISEISDDKLYFEAALAFKAIHLPDSALKYFKKSIAFKNQPQQDFYTFQAKNELAEWYLNNNESQKALGILLGQLKIKKFGDEVKIKTYSLLAVYYWKTNQYPSYAFYNEKSLRCSKKLQENIQAAQILSLACYKDYLQKMFLVQQQKKDFLCLSLAIIGSALLFLLAIYFLNLKKAAKNVILTEGFEKSEPDFDKEQLIILRGIGQPLNLPAIAISESLHFEPRYHSNENHA